MASVDVEDAVIASACCVILAKQRTPRRYWVRPSLRSRCVYSGSDLLKDLKEDDCDPLTGELRTDGSVKNFLRMASSDFEYLVMMIGPKIVKKDTNWRAAIPVQEKLAVTLRFFASGDSYTIFSYLFKISKSTISLFVPEVCDALIELLKENVKLPSTKEEWRHHSDEYNKMWNFPYCIGSIDGKNVMLQAPINTGSDYFNYKGFFSIVLLAVVDANYCFIYVSVGCQGRISDGGVFDHCSLNKMLKDSSLHLPNTACLPSRTFPVPYVLLVDDAFPLRPYMLKPYPGSHDKESTERIFNYRHCRSRRVVETAFGILSVVFRVLRKPLLLEPETAEQVVLTCVHLHNFLRNSKLSSASYTPNGTFDFEDTANNTFVPGQWRVDGIPSATMLKLKKVPKKPSKLAKAIRQEFSEYFKSDEGSVP